MVSSHDLTDLDDGEDYQVFGLIFHMAYGTMLACTPLFHGVVRRHTVTTVNLWLARDRSWSYLNKKHPLRVAVVMHSFELIDKCISHYEEASSANVYARVCGLTLLKGKNLAQGALSLVLDALGQESGALLRPLVEYIELLTYLRKYPEQAERAAANDLPPAGKRAQAIAGIYKELREHLSENASHSAYSHYSLSHLLMANFSFRKLQEFHPQVLDKNLTDLTVQLHFLLQEGLLALEHIPGVPILALATEAESLRKRTLLVFGLDGS